MTDDERREIAASAKTEANVENRLSNLEAGMKRIWAGVGIAALMILASIWDTLKGVLFK